MKPNNTDRLTFKPVTPEDAGQLDALNNAPGVMRFLDRSAPSLEHIAGKLIPEWIKTAQEHPGYGLWLAFLREDDSFVGQFGLQPNSPGTRDAEIGYRLLPRLWGQGLGSEGARELVRYALDDLNAERVVAITMALNTPSRRVMERIGLQYVRTFHEDFDDPLPGTEEGEVEYALSLEKWLLRRSEG